MALDTQTNALGILLKALRGERTVYDMAGYLGVASGTLVQYELGRRRPSSARLLKYMEHRPDATGELLDILVQGGGPYEWLSFTPREAWETLFHQYALRSPAPVAGMPQVPKRRPNARGER